MGCSQSKIENEETVRRCKERKRHMKDAVSTRNAFAAAHSAYAMALKNTGAALSDYAQGEVQYPSSSVPGGGPILTQAPVELPLPPPPLPPFPPLQRAATMPEMSFQKPDLKHADPIMEEDNEDELESESVHGLQHRRRKSSGGRSGISHGEVVDDEELPKPPSPPPPAQTPPPPPQSNRGPPPHPPPETSGMASWDYFFSMENVTGPTLADVDEGRVEREELERKVLEERAQRSEIDAAGGDGGSVRGRRSGAGKAEVEEVVDEEAPEVPPPPPSSQVASPPPKVVKRVKQVVPPEGKRSRGSSAVNLLQIFSELDDCFLHASESAHEVSKMLEAARLHYHSNFADNRGIRQCQDSVFDCVVVGSNFYILKIFFKKRTLAECY